jgi:hypothetical protein
VANIISTTSEVSSLSAALRCWEIAEYVFAFFVAVACAGEYIADFTNLFTQEEREAKERLAKRSTLLLIVALVLELICLVKTNSISGMLTGSLRDTAEEADRKSRSAVDKAGVALDKSGQAILKANAAGSEAEKAETAARIAIGKSDRANAAAGNALSSSNAATNAASEAQEKVGAVAEQAEDLDRALWQAEYWLTSRNVTDRESLVKAPKKFKGQKIDFVSYAGDPEGDIFCNALLNAAYSAGVDIANRCGGEPAIATRPGIIETGILVSGPSISETIELGSILANNTNCPAGSARAPAPKLTVLVGFHPPFVMDKRRVFKPQTKKQTSKPNTKP